MLRGKPDNVAAFVSVSLVFRVLMSLASPSAFISSTCVMDCQPPSQREERKNKGNKPHRNKCCQAGCSEVSCGASAC